MQIPLAPGFPVRTYTNLTILSICPKLAASRLLLSKSTVHLIKLAATHSQRPFGVSTEKAEPSNSPVTALRDAQQLREGEATTGQG